MDPARSDLLGICRISDCDAPQATAPTSSLANGRCFKHTVFLWLSRRGVIPNTKSISKLDAVKRGDLALKLRAHYNSIASGEFPPLSKEDRLRLAYALRSELHIHWNGSRGLLGTAQVIADVENLAGKVMV